MIEAFYGKSGIATGILIDTLGTYLILSTLGVTIACIYSRGTASACGALVRIVAFPPLIAVSLAMVLNDVAYPAWLTDTLARLGGTLAPLALVSVGLQLRLDAWTRREARGRDSASRRQSRDRTPRPKHWLEPPPLDLFAIWSGDQQDGAYSNGTSVDHCAAPRADPESSSGGCISIDYKPHVGPNILWLHSTLEQSNS
jgi:hypothetical protein